MATWKLMEPPVPSALRRDVSHVRVFQVSGPQPYTVKVAPIAVPGLVFHQRGQGPAIRSIVTPQRTTTRLPLAFLYGAGTTPSTMAFFGGPHLTVQIIFKPYGLRSLLGLDARPLRNGVLSLGDLPGAPPLTQLLAAGPRAKAMLLLRYLERRAEGSVTHDRVVAQALDLIERHIATLRLPQLLEDLGFSERQLERRFKRSVGVSPKTYLRVRRFNEAVRLMKTGSYPTLTDVAHALNFSDQSHFIRDLKAFTRITPRDIFQRVSQFHEQGGFSYEA